MAYNEFAYFYDELNGAADYDALFQYIHAQLKKNGLTDGIVADLGCGTGELTLRLAQAGYDVIGVDCSEDMLCVVRDKAEQLRPGKPLLLLCQDILQLDLYGTIRAAVSTFDTYNHIPPHSFERAVQKAALFMEKGGLFVFDMNTPYKHKEILGQNQYEIETPELRCLWRNQYDDDAKRVEISLTIRDRQQSTICRERFFEYSYTPEYVRGILSRCGFHRVQCMDGETFQGLRPKSQRIIFTAEKEYTQNGDKR